MEMERHQQLTICIVIEIIVPIILKRESDIFYHGSLLLSLDVGSKGIIVNR